MPGLNSVIKSVVYRATEMGYEVLGIRRGWEGLTHLRPGAELDPDYVRPLDRVEHADDRPDRRHVAPHLADEPAQDARSGAARLDRRAGVADADRSPTGVVDLTPVVLDNIERLGLDVLVTIGGDDTLSASRTVLVDAGVPLVAIPKTMDNDVQGTEYCIGFSTAITRAQGADQPPADDARQPRADRRVPDLRAGRRVLGAVRGVCHVARGA